MFFQRPVLLLTCHIKRDNRSTRSRTIILALCVRAVHRISFYFHKIGYFITHQSPAPAARPGTRAAWGSCYLGPTVVTTVHSKGGEVSSSLPRHVAAERGLCREQIVVAKGFWAGPAPTLVGSVVGQMGMRLLHVEVGGIVVARTCGGCLGGGWWSHGTIMSPP